MDRIHRVLAHLRSTFYPIRPLLTGAIGLLRQDLRLVLVMLVLCILAVTAVREVSNAWVHHWLTERLPVFDQQLEICKMAREFPNDPPRALCGATVFGFSQQLNLHNSIADTAKLSAAAAVTVMLYLLTSARMASRLAASRGRTAVALRRETAYACLAVVAIVLAPTLLFWIIKIAHGYLDGLWAIDFPYSHRPTILHGSLAAIWFVVAAPFVLPALPLALTSGRDSSFAEASRLGWTRYLQFAALAAAATAPFIGAATLANWSMRMPVISFLANRLDLGVHFSRGVFDALLTALALVAVVAIATAFTVAVGHRMQDAR